MSVRNHIVITGTGRAGTTFLVELLTELGLDTGFSADNIGANKREISGAGLELDIRKQNCPYIVKSPWFCDYAEEVMRCDDIVIKHIFIPIRELHGAAESRRQVSRQNEVWGGLWHTNSHEPGKQEEILLNQLYKLLLAISDKNIPVTFMRYPRIIRDCSYLFEKLKPILQLHNISLEFFSRHYKRTVRPELVHSYNSEDC